VAVHEETLTRYRANELAFKVRSQKVFGEFVAPIAGAAELIVRMETVRQPKNGRRTATEDALDQRKREGSCSTYDRDGRIKVCYEAVAGEAVLVRKPSGPGRVGLRRAVFQEP
jgi:hypothetical protein